MNKKNERALQKILSDKTSGSVELLRRLNSFIKNNFEEFDDPLLLLKNLKKQFQSFQIIQDYLEKISGLLVAGQFTMEFFDSFTNSNSLIIEQIFTNALPFLKNKNNILTISNSQTVFEILKRLRTVNKNLHVTISESRPKLEGRIFAKKILSADIKVSLITEAMLAQYVESCSCALIGADAVLKGNIVVNKIGSLQTAILCKYYSKPVYVVTSKAKFCNRQSYKKHVESKDEIWKNAPSNVAINNVYFETIPELLITKIITE